MTKPVVTEEELHAYVEGVLPAARAAEVEAYLASRPDEAARVSAYREQIVALHREFDPIVNEPLPYRLQLPRRHWARSLLRYAAVGAWFGLGGVAGWQLHAYTRDQQADVASWPRRAAIAHVVYSPEVRHPVEVGAEQEAHLVAWLSKRLGAPLKVPYLGDQGYQLVGGRLLPGERGPVAQFMYQETKGQRLTLYVRVNADKGGETAFRFAREHGVGVFYWLDQELGYAISGEVEKDELLRLATAVHRQLNP
jgi:anti-sigma factor RsiW